MVNKKNFLIKACLVTPLFFFILFSSCKNQKYLSSFQAKGILYHIFPQEGFRNNNSEFIYDLTYTSKTDSATLNFSYYDKGNIVIDSLRLKGKKQYFTGNTNKIYVDTHKKYWKYRYSASFSFNNLKSFFSSDDAPQIILYTNNNEKVMSINKSRWKKQSKLIGRIFNLISLNN